MNRVLLSAMAVLALAFVAQAESPASQPTSQPASRPAEELTLDLGGGVSMKLVLIPAGEFQMGSPASEAHRQQNETQHTVKITKPFYMGATEVTQEQYEAVMGKNPSEFNGGKNPVERVSWNDATEFCRKLSGKTGKAIRLPTEAEWEYACRAGTTTPFHFGATISSDQANYDATFAYGRGEKGDARDKTMPVGSFLANAWGLHDMHGNVWEWCRDWYGEYAGGPLADPTGPVSGSQRVLRGGAWYNDPSHCRSADRTRIGPALRIDGHGFRVVVEAAGGVD
jgi:formylglycine-generating enzyme required for sulfatase activity